MIQSGVLEVEEIEKIEEFEITREEMRSILLPMSEESRQFLIDEYEKYKNGYKPTKRTCIGIIIDRETGKITYD